MADTNLFALNELLEKIKAGEGTAKTNLEALNALCVLAGGQGGHKTNLDALNEFLTVFSPASPSQEKNLAVTENGNYEVTPDEGYTLAKVGVSVDVPSLPEQAKTVTITENGTTEITPDEGFTLSSVTAEVAVALEGGELKLKAGYAGGGLYTAVQKVDFTRINFSLVKNFSNTFNGFSGLTQILWPKAVSFNTPFKMNQMFYNCYNLTEIDLSSFTFKRGITDLENFAYLCQKLHTFTFGANHTEVSGSMNNLFYQCNKLVTCDISALGTGSVKSIADAFFYCKKLENLIVGDNFLASSSVTTFSLSTCTALTHNSLVDIISKLAVRENSPLLGLGETNLAKLTEAEIAIATGKGWTVN